MIDSVPTFSVDQFCRDNLIDRISILNTDIQGCERRMLTGAARMLEAKKIDYLFISTHSNDLHLECMEFLRSCNYDIVCEANLDEAYQADGFIVDCRRDLARQAIRPIAKASTHLSSPVARG
jgi:Methyltransferase FkbM domain